MKFDEAGFVHYLLYDVLVHKGTEVYYSYWVKQFIREYDSEAGSWQVQLTSYLENMRKEDEFLEWQADQAERAIRIYFSGFLKQPSVVDESENVGPAEEIVLDIDTLVENFKSLLRTQKCGAHTEKIYAGWVRKYLEFQLGNVEKETFSRKELERGVAKFLENLVSAREVVQSDRKQAFTALQIFFRLIFEQDISRLRFMLE